MTPFIIGLTGGIGSGKSTVADGFAKLGIAVIDADAIAHSICAPGAVGALAIRREFGDEYFDTAGNFDRAKMRKLVFADSAQKKRLEAVLHPLIRAETDRQVQAATSPYVILMVPLLIESGDYRKRIHRLLVVDVSEATQIARVQKRNGFGRDQVEAIMAVQAMREQRLAAADDVIDNEAAPEFLTPRIALLHADYLERAKAHAAAPPSQTVH